MNPIEEILLVLGPLITREVDVTAAIKVFGGYELTHLGQNPVPAFVAHADEIFLDPKTRPWIVGILTKHLMTLAPKVEMEITS